MTLFNGIFSFCFYAIDFWLRCRQPSGRFSVGGADVEPAKKKSATAHKNGKNKRIKMLSESNSFPTDGFFIPVLLFFFSKPYAGQDQFLSYANVFEQI